jgi:hypothetical protein
VVSIKLGFVKTNRSDKREIIEVDVYQLLADMSKVPAKQNTNLWGNEN